MADAPRGPPTIIARKQTFLAAQTNLLSQPVAVSARWGRTNDASKQPIKVRALEDAMFRLNHKIQQHCIRVYAPLASRNIAEQISSTYMRDVERRRDEVDSGIGKEIDLLDPEAVESLPDTWPLEKDTNADPTSSGAYVAMLSELKQYSARQKALTKRLENLRQLQKIVGQLVPTTRSGDGDSGDEEPSLDAIQENLPTRNGPVEQELERMKALLQRVSQGVGNIRKKDVRPEQPPAPKEDRKRTLDEFLDGTAFA